MSVLLRPHALSGDPAFKVRKLFQFCKKPSVNFGDVVYLLQGIPVFDRLENSEQSAVVGNSKPLSSGRLLIGAALSVSSEISAPRTAFISAASKLVAMAITSPVALIWVPSTRLAVLNFSKGHLGSLTTT